VIQEVSPIPSPTQKINISMRETSFRLATPEMPPAVEQQVFSTPSTPLQLQAVMQEDNISHEIVASQNDFMSSVPVTDNY